MKKSVILLSFALAMSLPAFSQTKLGLRLSPGLSFSRSEAANAGNVENSNAALRFTFGPIADIFFRENYAFSTGLWFSTRRVGFRAASVTNNQTDAPSGDYYINTQYLQLPVSIKLFTNEVSPDLRIFFQLGGTVDIKIQENPDFSTSNDNALLLPFDVGALVGSGFELVMGPNTILLGGLSYNRGLLNVMRRRANNNITVNQASIEQIGRLNSRQDFVSVDIGIKF